MGKKQASKALKMYERCSILECLQDSLFCCYVTIQALDTIIHEYNCLATVSGIVLPYLYL